MEQIEQSGQPGREVVLGAMALWVAAHGDFELPARESAEPEPAEAVTIPNTDESLVDEELLPVGTSTEIARVAFDDIARRQDVSVAPTSPEGIENVVALKQAFTDLFAPYVAGVNAHIQHAKKLPRWKSEGVDTWQAVQTLRGLPTNVFFSARYTSHDKYNEALGLEVAYSRRSKPHKRDLHISLDFKDGGRRKINYQNCKR